MANSKRLFRSPKAGFALTASILVALLAVLLLWLTDWSLLVIWLLAINAITFLLYGFDKNQSQGSGQRVPEIVLHLLALVGGFLGGWLGRLVFHHKTRKPVFAIVLAVSTVVWVVIIVWLL